MSTTPKRKILICPDCFWTWNNTSEKNEVSCPKCDRKIDARDRSEYWKKRIIENPEILQKVKEDFFKTDNKERRRKSNTKIRIRALALVGNGDIKCFYCGCDDIRLLEINHINGNGNKEFKELGNTWKLVKNIVTLKRKTDDLNVACRICNAKHYLEYKFGKLSFEVIWKK